MSFLASLAAFQKQSTAASALKANPVAVKESYKHPLYRKLEAVSDDCEKFMSAYDDAGIGEGLTIMFMIIDILPYEAIWRAWLSNGSPELRKNVKILIHAKFPGRIQSPWVKEHLCQTFQLKPDWGSLELTDVMIRLLNEALGLVISSTEKETGTETDAIENKKQDIFDGEKDDTEVDKDLTNEVNEVIEDENGDSDGDNLRLSSHSHFCFASESCIPIVPLDCVFKELNSSVGSSWLDYSNQACNGYAQQLQFDVLNNTLPSKCLFKSDQWLLLSRKHALAICDLPSRVTNMQIENLKSVESKKEIINQNQNQDNFGGTSILSGHKNDRSSLLSLFKKVRASDEMYFPCCLGILGLLDRAEKENEDNVKNKIKQNQQVVCKRPFTWADWSEGGKNPRSYSASSLSHGNIKEARDKGCMFMRKIKLELNNTTLQNSSSKVTAASTKDDMKSIIMNHQIQACIQQCDLQETEGNEEEEEQTSTLAKKDGDLSGYETNKCHQITKKLDLNAIKRREFTLKWALMILKNDEGDAASLSLQNLANKTTSILHEHRMSVVRDRDNIKRSRSWDDEEDEDGNSQQDRRSKTVKSVKTTTLDQAKEANTASNSRKENS